MDKSRADYDGQGEWSDYEESQEISTHLLITEIHLVILVIIWSTRGVVELLNLVSLVLLEFSIIEFNSSMSKETLIVLNRKCGATKAQLTRIKDFIKNPDEKDKMYLESKLDTLKSLRIKLSDIRNEYYEVVENDSDLEPLETEILDLEDDCEDIQVRIKNILSNIDLKNNAAKSCENSFKNIKLPDIQLP
ncbi:uncharacterized protein TNIN_222121 [Trichonephila inaurata madagascariensis]|uniref:Uncharacterized protein n=1 Tax=Trichonephila inaurata madagascariensis TaxID=2747483 RepID=A0A8X6IA05_9ARAC|nr:uncharacterized protein TNIN_222121 [Trichonephila inaurata madagascariensis]